MADDFEIADNYLCTLSRAYLDLSAQIEAERDRLIELEQENAALLARLEESK